MFIDKIQTIRTLNFKRTYNVAKVFINEYKFFIDFKGIMYFDDDQMTKNAKNVINDKKFIQKFYQSLKYNDESSQHVYHYSAQFWGEKNYLRSAIAPIIYNNLVQNQLQFSIGLKIPFNPQHLYLDQSQQLSYNYQSLHIPIKGKLSNKLLNELIPHILYTENDAILHYNNRSFNLSHQAP